MSAVDLIHFASALSKDLPVIEDAAGKLQPDALKIYEHGQKIAQLLGEVEAEVLEIQRIAGPDVAEVLKVIGDLKQ